VEHVTASGIGEPLLNPHFFSLIDLFAERQITCEFYTNGTLLTPQNCEAILKRRNIVSLAISCDGAEKKTFENFRVGANFESWIRSVRYFTMKKKEERPDLNISMFTVINKQNLNELGKIIHLAAELGFNNVHFLDPIPIDDLAEANVPSKIEVSSINLDDLLNLGRSHGVGVSWWIRRDKMPPMAILRCLQPWESIFIRVNGDIQPCCAVFGADKAPIMGNIFREKFSDIWNGDRFYEFRRTSVKGTNSLCPVCPYY
jgi:radical SAM protein with 4Fe4S-binding SPASM domain